MGEIVPVNTHGMLVARVPEILVRAGANAVFAAEEFFKATINNTHTKRAYGRAVARFLVWCEEKGVELRQITPASMSASSRSQRQQKIRFSRRCATSSTAS